MKDKEKRPAKKPSPPIPDGKPRNKVEWFKDQCWDKFADKQDFCPEGASQAKGERNNVERFVGGACICDDSSLGSNGFYCPQQCERKPHLDKIKDCQKTQKICHVDPKTKAPFCGCPNGKELRNNTGGSQTCDTYDVCFTCKHKCHKASVCQPAISSMTGYSCAPCDIDKGYIGVDGVECSDIDECLDASKNDCDVPNAICENKEPIYDDGLKYVCACRPGWTADKEGGYKSRPCKDVDECLEKNACDENAVCTNTPGSFTCTCKKGFVKDSANPKKCIDIDECKKLDQCHKKATCKNIPGDFTCKCIDKYIGDGIKSCKPDEKQWCGDCDKETTTCKLNDKGDAYSCQCNEGFVPIPGNKNKCQDILECSFPSKNKCDKTPGCSTCIEKPGSYECKCNKGYEGDGIKCKSTDPCIIKNPCATVAGSQCVSVDGKATCKCKIGFVRQVKDESNMTAPCYDIKTHLVNNCSICDNVTAECKQVGNGPHYSCDCKAGYQRNAAGFCRNINECAHRSENDCEGNSICIDKEPALHGKRFECKCKKGLQRSKTTGKCEDINECENAEIACPLPYQNCTNTIGSYTCPCLNGFRKPDGHEVCIDINECEEASANCPPNSHCIDESPGYKCSCKDGFRKKILENKTMICENINECVEGITPSAGKNTSACDKDYGICKDIEGSYLCDCKPGFTLSSDGSTCKDKNECALEEDNCNAMVEKCNNTIGSFVCDCNKGLEKDATGKCVDINECTKNLSNCYADSSCVNIYSSYKCVCDVGFVVKPGSHPMRPACMRENICVKQARICHPGSCQQTDETPYFKCICPGNSVALNTTKCVFPNYCDDKYLCPGDSECVSNQCVCAPGFNWQEPKIFPLTVENALINRAPCREINPCHQSASLCVSPLICRHVGPGQHKCECQMGFEVLKDESGKFSCADIDECSLKEGGAKCPVNSACSNLQGSYKCECKKGYVAKVGSTLINPECEDINECEAGIDDCGKKNATCTNTIGSFACNCSAGFALSAPDYTDCKDINECEAKTAQCDKNANCNNVPGSYECKCKIGYSGNGETCWDVDECNAADPKHNCTKTQECLNTEGGFNCTCSKGYELTSKGCTDINECLNPANNNCKASKGADANKKCVNTDGDYLCVCYDGYTDIEGNCKDTNECLLSPSVCPAGPSNVCKNTNGSFECGCIEGFKKPKGTDKMTSCIDINECEEGVKGKKACGKDAKCENLSGSYKCLCGPGYEGDAYTTGCTLSDVCVAGLASNKYPCNNRTQDCLSVDGKAKCICKAGYVSAQNKDCIANPCLMNNGNCGKTATCLWIAKVDTVEAQCKCKENFQLTAAKECEAIDFCKCEKPSLSGCKSKISCSADHMLCIGASGGAICTCEDGYKLSADKKECINIDECKEGVDVKELKACEDNAKCHDLPGSYTCDCPRGLTESSDHKCIPDVNCQREGKCIDDKNSYCGSEGKLTYCMCKTGFEGNATVSSPCKKIDFCAKAAKDGKGPCEENENCVNLPTRYNCECKKGFFKESPGKPCEDINECQSSSVCKITEVCNNTIGSYVCGCPSGFQKNSTTARCDDVDECAQKKDNCEAPIQRCINTPGSFRCDCNTPAYMEAVGSSVCVDSNECETNQYNCPEFSTCANKEGSYDCICDAGFTPETKDNKTIKCNDIDECDVNKKSCPEGAKCTNKRGTYACECNPPLIQHGPQDCVVNASCTNACHINAFCLRSAKENGAVYNCTCAPGYRGDGVKTCDPIDECKEKTHNCHARAECIDRTPLYECKCIEPYEGDGKNQCNKKDVCKVMNDCPKGSDCIPLEKAEEGKYVTCKCAAGFKFNPKTRSCDDINECEETPPIGPCMKSPSGVKCVNTQGSYVCICPDGYIINANKTECIDVNECLDNGKAHCAKTGGTCQNTPGSFECVCPEKVFTCAADKKACNNVDECTLKTDNCDPTSTTCKDLVGSFKCECKPGFVKVPGKTNQCEDENECETGTHNCKALTQLCHNTIGSYFCNCSNGYTPKDKECVPMSNCEDKTKECGANAFCARRAGKDAAKMEDQCICQDGYYGTDPNKFCDPVPDCEKGSNQCPSNAKCVETQAKDGKGRATFLCVCDSGYKKTGSQCVDINECSEYPDICGKKAVCVNQAGSYHCGCDTGTVNVGTGAGNVTCVASTCATQESTPCHPDADCIDESNGFTCKCRKGFRGAGTKQLGCTQIDQCVEWSPCSQYATCVNSPRGSVTCTCKAGYTGNGTMCYDIDECTVNKDTACDPKANCTNSQGGYRCDCDDGYIGSGLPGQCTDINECADARLNKCDVKSSSCKNILGSFECTCKDGFYRNDNNTNAYACDDDNECKDPKKNGCGIHRCNNLEGSYSCECNPGFKLSPDAKSCVDLDECESRPCHQHGQCTNMVGSFICACQNGYTGDGIKNCDLIDKCSDPKLNQCCNKTTTCENIKNQAAYRCNCVKGYAPPKNFTQVYYHCEDIDECLSGGGAIYDSRLENCINLPGSYKTECKDGYTRNIETQKCDDLDECSEDAAYKETLDKFNAAEKENKKLNPSDWKDWMIPPKNKTSAYGICYNRMIEGGKWAIAGSPIPFCRNALYDSGMHLNARLELWKGFECTCPPGQNRTDSSIGTFKKFTCEDADPCKALNCGGLGEGWICNKNAKTCECDRANRYRQQTTDSGSICTQKECTGLEEAGPPTMKSRADATMVTCNKKTNRWEAPKGYTLGRCNVTGDVLTLDDIDECKNDENFCCDRKLAQCKEQGGNKTCTMECHNTRGSALCYCGGQRENIKIVRETCQCEALCGKQSQWYLKCAGTTLTCDMEKWRKLSESSTAPKGPVCSRILDGSTFKTFPNMLALITEICETTSWETMPPVEVDDITMHPVFNYDGECIKVESQLSKVKCSGNGKAEFQSMFQSAVCPFRIDPTTWPGKDPRMPPVKDTVIKFKSEALTIGTFFYLESGSYKMERG